MVSRIPVNGGYDRMYIEIPYEEYKSWNSEQTVCREKNKYRRLYQHFSLEQNFSEDEEQAEDWMLAAQDSVDFLVESDITTENLLKALALWQPWAVDLYYAYVPAESISVTGSWRRSIRSASARSAIIKSGSRSF